MQPCIIFNKYINYSCKKCALEVWEGYLKEHGHLQSIFQTSLTHALKFFMSSVFESHRICIIVSLFRHLWINRSLCGHELLSIIILPVSIRIIKGETTICPFIAVMDTGPKKSPALCCNFEVTYSYWTFMKGYWISIRHCVICSHALINWSYTMTPSFDICRMVSNRCVFPYQNSWRSLWRVKKRQFLKTFFFRLIVGKTKSLVWVVQLASQIKSRQLV